MDFSKRPAIALKFIDKTKRFKFRFWGERSVALITDTCGRDAAKTLKQWSADKWVAQWKRGVRPGGPKRSIEQFYLNMTLSKVVGPGEN